MNDPLEKVHITQSTYVSVGVVIVIVLCTLWIKTGQSDSSLALQNMSNKLEGMDTRLKSLEQAKNSWSAVDMFKWAVHLQQSNPQIKVPEPDVSK